MGNLRCTHPVQPMEGDEMTRELPHHQAAFINAIADEGSKEEAIHFLQETWNELCELKKKHQGTTESELTTLRTENERFNLQLAEGLRVAKAHVDWCKKYSGDSDKDMGRYIGADEVYATMKAALQSKEGGA